MYRGDQLLRQAEPMLARVEVLDKLAQRLSAPYMSTNVVLLSENDYRSVCRINRGYRNRFGARTRSSGRFRLGRPIAKSPS